MDFPQRLKNELDCNSDPINAILDNDGNGVLAFIIGVDGPSYRPLGAMMAIFPDETFVGSLSSGCVEADLITHAMQCLKDNRPKQIRYGKDSPYFDIKLPCGGGLDILLLPYPDREVLRSINVLRAERQQCVLAVDMVDGTCALANEGRLTGIENSIFYVQFLPSVRFLVFGKGPEASTFSALVSSLKYPNILFSPDKNTLDWVRGHGVEACHISSPTIPNETLIDRWTAVILFFHDHSWEPGILKKALNSEAFYIGAQGSRRARDARHTELLQRGVSDADIGRLYGPIGLIPSARDARTLAISVLAEALMVLHQRKEL